MAARGARCIVLLLKRVLSQAKKIALGNPTTGLPTKQNRPTVADGADDAHEERPGGGVGQAG